MKYYSIGQFANMTGVSERTLRYYDQIGLLKPSFVSESGRRYYQAKDLVPLQTIVAFKYLGYSLEQIQQMLSENLVHLTSSLKIQKKELLDKREHLDQIIKAIDTALNIFEQEQEMDPLVFSYLIHSILHEKDDLEWMQKSLPEEVMLHLTEKLRDQEYVWKKRSVELVTKLKAAIQCYAPDSEEVQRLIGEYFLLMQEMLGKIKINMFQQIDLDSYPYPYTSPFTQEEEEKLQQAVEYYLAHHPLPDGWEEE